MDGTHHGRVHLSWSRIVVTKRQTVYFTGNLLRCAHAHGFPESVPQAPCSNGASVNPLLSRVIKVCSIMSYLRSSGAKQVSRFQDHHQIVLGPDGQAKIGPRETSKDRSTIAEGTVAGAKGPGHTYYKSLATTKTGCWQDELRTSGPVHVRSSSRAAAAPPAEAAGGFISEGTQQTAVVQSKQVRHSDCCMPREGNDLRPVSCCLLCGRRQWGRRLLRL